MEPETKSTPLENFCGNLKKIGALDEKTRSAFWELLPRGTTEILSEVIAILKKRNGQHQVNLFLGEVLKGKRGVFVVELNRKMKQFLSK